MRPRIKPNWSGKSFDHKNGEISVWFWTFSRFCTFADDLKLVWNVAEIKLSKITVLLISVTLMWKITKPNYPLQQDDNTGIKLCILFCMCSALSEVLLIQGFCRRDLEGQVGVKSVHVAEQHLLQQLNWNHVSVPPQPLTACLMVKSWISVSSCCLLIPPLNRN